MIVTQEYEAIPRRVLLAAKADWPATDWHGWHAYADGKRASRSVESAPESIKLVLQEIVRHAALIDADDFPDLSFYAAGLHELPEGTGLGWHRDAEFHPLKPWRRVATAILYLDDGGTLEFSGPQAVPEIEPRSGLLVTFENDPQYRHRVQAGGLRRSLCVFFYRVDHGPKGRTQAEFFTEG